MKRVSAFCVVISRGLFLWNKPPQPPIGGLCTLVCAVASEARKLVKLVDLGKLIELVKLRNWPSCQLVGS